MHDDWRAVHEAGHRNFVGGNDQYWDLISALQFEFLVKQGLKPSDTFFDVGCGSLRAGVRLIRFLNADQYVGVDKHIELVIYGVALELGVELYRAKRPRFIVSGAFAFEEISVRPTMAIAQSLFTHLNPEDISRCLTNLHRVAALGCRFFVTFFESDGDTGNPASSHSHGHFAYTRGQMESFASQTGWRPNYIGSWNHPRNQQMIEFVSN